MEVRIDSRRKAMATINLGIVIAVPILNPKNDAVWQTAHVNNDSFGIVLEGYDPQDLARQVLEQIERFKEQWKDHVISMKNWQSDAEQISSRMEQNLS